MRTFSSVHGTRALRLLALSSAVALTACGGGGGGDVVETPPAAKRVVITAENQQEVAMHAGATVTLMGPIPVFIGASLIGVLPEENNNVYLASGSPSLQSSNSAAALLGKTLGKIRSAKKSAPSAIVKDSSYTESRTYDVACVSGSGTVTFTSTDTYGDNNGSESESGVATLDNCKLDVGGENQSVVVNGKAEFNSVYRWDNEADSYTGNASLRVTQFSLKAADSDTLQSIDIAIDGDMNIEMTDDGYVSTGDRFALSVSGTLEDILGQMQSASDPEIQTIDLAMLNYRQQVQFNEGTEDEASNFTATTQATVETSIFGGETASYELSTPEALKYEEVGYAVDGQLKIVGAEGTILWITADGEGTFTLERDDAGDGTIDGTVEGLTPLQLLLIVVPYYGVA